jgi:fatty-acyl-CoA synthase
VLDGVIRHVHFKDLTKDAAGAWVPALVGQGEFPLLQVVRALQDLHYGGFVSFEWEKKWYPSIPPADVAVPRFAEWWRKHSA